MALSVLPSFTNATEEQKKHPIDVWLQTHISDDESTAGMRNTTNNAREMWEAEMNKVYNRLMSKLTPKQQAALREAQRDWLKFRDSEGKAISEIIAARDGTMYQLIATSDGMQLVRERALTLIAYEFGIEN
jgi:uncharacterized protein YecT (DUF1311 family)